MFEEGNAPSQRSREIYFRLGKEISKMLLNAEEACDKVYRDDFYNAAHNGMVNTVRDFTPKLSNLPVEILDLHVKEGNYGIAFSLNSDDRLCSIEELERCLAIEFYYDENGKYVSGELPNVDQLVEEYRNHINRDLSIIRKNTDFADKVNKFIGFYLTSPAVKAMVYDEDFALGDRELFESLGKAYAEVREELGAGTVFGELDNICTQLRDDQDAGLYAHGIKQSLDQMEQLYRDLEQQQ